MDLVCFTLIIDDIVLPDGTTCMAQLGGGGAQALFGYQLTSRCLNRPTDVGLTAGIGQDLPDHCKAWLQQLGCDTSGLLPTAQPTPRAWQVFEWDGKRTQVWRVPECPELYQQLLPAFEQLPDNIQHSTNYHLGIHAAHPPQQLLRALRQATQRAGGHLSLETYTHCESPPNPDDLADLLQLCDVFSPNELEAASIVGAGSPQQLVLRLLAAGGTTVALRCGAQGAWIGHKPSQTLVHVPAVPDTKVVDVTGCGNAFCGGFLAAQHAGLDVVDSGMWGCIAGSVMAEWQGVPSADVQQLVQTAGERFEKLQQLEMQRFELSTEGLQQVGSQATARTPCSSRAAVGSTSSTTVFSTRGCNLSAELSARGHNRRLSGAEYRSVGRALSAGQYRSARLAIGQTLVSSRSSQLYGMRSM